MTETPRELVIVGGGPVGAILACRLAGHGARVTLVEGSAEPLPAAYDDRALALALASQRLIATAGAWDAALAAQATPMTRIDIAQQHVPGTVAPLARLALGAVVAEGAGLHIQTTEA